MGKFGISVTEIATLILPVSHSLPERCALMVFFRVEMQLKMLFVSFQRDQYLC